MSKHDDTIAKALRAASDKLKAQRGCRSRGIVGVDGRDPVGWERADDPTVKIATAILAGFAANPAYGLADAFMVDEGFGDKAVEQYACKALNIAQELLTQNAKRPTGIKE